MSKKWGQNVAHFGGTEKKGKLAESSLKNMMEKGGEQI